MSEIDRRVLDAVAATANEGRITCAQLRKLAEDMGIPYADAGAAANELGIRLKNCELGCF